MGKRKVNRIPKKNKNCHACDLYTLYGVRSCKGIKGKHFIEFKSQCPCCSCLVRPMCKRKFNSAARELLGGSYASVIGDVCYIFDSFRENFIQSIPEYYTDCSYQEGDLHYRELHYMTKVYNLTELINKF